MVDSSVQWDFGKAADQAGGLNYSDLKQAYSGGCDLVNPQRFKQGECRPLKI